MAQQDTLSSTTITPKTNNVIDAAPSSLTSTSQDTVPIPLLPKPCPLPQPCHNFDVLKEMPPPVSILSTNPNTFEILVFISGWITWISYFVYRYLSKV